MMVNKVLLELGLESLGVIKFQKHIGSSQLLHLPAEVFVPPLTVLDSATKRVGKIDTFHLYEKHSHVKKSMS